MELTAPVESWEALALVCGLTLAAILLALVYTRVRHWLYLDAHTLDVAYDSGGKVSASLTAVSLVGQLLWPCCLLEISTSSYSKVQPSIITRIWSGLPMAIVTLLFLLTSLGLRTRAPGAKTFLQVIEARFGRYTHLLFCVFALLTNLVLTTTLLVSGATLVKTVVKGTSNEMAVLMMTVLFGAHTFVGGLGAIFYVSFINVATIMCVLSYVAISDGDNFTPMDPSMNIAQGTLNQELNTSGLNYSGTTPFGECLVGTVKGTLLCLALVFCDQASWQNMIATKPLQGVTGFLGASLVLFTIGASVGAPASHAFFALNQTYSFSNNSGVLGANISLPNSNDGNVTPLTVYLTFGKYGGVCVFLVFAMVAMASGSRAVKSVSSIIVYDIYQKYVEPFKSRIKTGHCQLCERPILGETIEPTCIDESDLYCCCPLVDQCLECSREKMTLAAKVQETVIYDVYSCPVHGQYRAYQDCLVNLHHWVVLFVTLCVIPVGMLAITSQLNAAWIFSFGGLMTLPAVPGIVLSMAWVKATSQGVIAGSAAGVLCGIAANMVCATILQDGLKSFLVFTTSDIPMVTGAATSLIVSLCVIIVVSLATHKIGSSTDKAKEWQTMRDIDNPLNPWQKSMRSRQITSYLGRRPTHHEIRKKERPAKMAALIGGCTLLVIFGLIIPGSLRGMNTMTSSNLQPLLNALQIVCLVTTAFVLVLPPTEEIWAIWCRLREKRKTQMERVENKALHSSQNPNGIELRTGLTVKD